MLKHIDFTEIKPGDTFVTEDPTQKVIYLGTFFCRIAKARANIKSVTVKKEVDYTIELTFYYDVKKGYIQSYRSFKDFAAALDFGYAYNENNPAFSNIEENAIEIALDHIRDMLIKQQFSRAVTAVSVTEDDLKEKEVSNMNYFTELLLKKGKTKFLKELKENKGTYPLVRT